MARKALTPEILTTEATIKVTGELALLKIDDDLYAYKRHQKLGKTTQKGSFKINVPFSKEPKPTQGFTDAAGAEAMKKGKLPKKDSPYSLFTPELKEYFRTVGRYGHISEAKGKQLYNLQPKDGVYDALLADPKRVDDIVLYDAPAGLLYDRKGKLLPVAVYFSYIDAHMNHRNYDLEKAAKHLLKRKDVVIFPGKKRFASFPTDEVDLDGQATTVEEAIVNIPSYNDGGRCIYFVWQPSQKDYARLMEAAKAKADQRKHTYIGSMETFEAAFELDILGLRKCGAARYDDFFGEYKDRNRYDEDED